MHGVKSDEAVKYRRPSRERTNRDSVCSPALSIVRYFRLSGTSDCPVLPIVRYFRLSGTSDFRYFRLSGRTRLKYLFRDAETEISQSPLLPSLHQSFSFQPPSCVGYLVAYRSGRYLSLRYDNVAALRWLPRSGYSALLPSRNKLFPIYAPLLIRLNDVTSVKIETEWLCGKHGARALYLCT
jgi:hypothetical protein